MTGIKTMTGITSLPAHRVREGHITLDGVVIDVSMEPVPNGGPDWVAIEHRNVRYLHRRDDVVQVFGRVSAEILEHIRQHVAAEGRTIRG